MEQGTTDVDIGDLGFWPPGSAFCIFYGPTPASTSDKPVPASDVTLVGKVISDATVLRDSASQIIRLEAVDD